MANGTPSSRLCVLKHLQKQKEQLVSSSRLEAFALVDDGEAEDPNRPKELESGMMQLFPSYVPSLQGGLYDIEVKQTVRNEVLASSQSFFVNAPRFTLPPGVVHSCYPPQGLGAHNNVLPHMVFSDPHIPWEQEGSPSQDLKDSHTPGILQRNKVPWLALLTFTEDELKLSAEELKSRPDPGAELKSAGLFPKEAKIPSKSFPPPPTGTREQNKATFSVQLTMGEYLEMGGNGDKVKATVHAPIQDPESLIHLKQQVEVIFVKASQFEDFVGHYDGDGARQTAAGETDKGETENKASQYKTPDVSRYKYLAHVRNVNTLNIAGSGLDDKGLYSIIMAHRSGPLNLEAPRPIIVHLVSLEGIGENLTLPLDKHKRVALVSLYSWTYLCLPPDQVSFVDSMRRIGLSIADNKCWLRAPESTFEKMKSGPSPSATAALGDTATAPKSLSDRLAQRLEDGYTMHRHKLQTGEEAPAFYRGPLKSTYVPAITESWWPFQSSFGTNYQVLDRDLGMMDISYSAAWQLGRTLAMENQAFTTSLVRLRGAIKTTGRRGALKAQAASHAVMTKKETLSSVLRVISELNGLASDQPGDVDVNSKNRFRHTPRAKIPDKSHLREAFGLVAAAAPSDDDEVEIPSNDINVPKNPDWQIVQSWIMDSLFLKNIPAHYLIPDPSYLPPESIRFFYIDENWFDAFIDGALSLGNHRDQKNDVVKQALKHNLNRYLATPYVGVDGSPLNNTPQVPCFGFVLRSAVVKALPDLEISCPWPDSSGGSGVREATLRYETIETDVLLCLFDRIPGSEHWDDPHILLSQPSHQQCFRIGMGGGLTRDALKVQFRAVYTTTEKPPADPAPTDPADESVEAAAQRYDSLRIIKWLADEDADPRAVEASIGSDGSDKKTPITDLPSLPGAVFDWQSRCIILPTFAAASHSIITHDMTRDDKKKYYDDPDGANAALVASVLASNVSKTRIDMPQCKPSDNSPRPRDFTVSPRQIRLPADESTNPVDWEVVSDSDGDSDDDSPPPEPNVPPIPPHQSRPAPPRGT